MDKLKFLDGTIIDIEEGGSLTEEIHIATNEASAVHVCEKVNAENVKHLEIYHGELLVGQYDNIIIADPTTRENGENGEVIVRMHFREKTELELRVDALEESQEVQDGAIEDIGMVLSDIAGEE